MSYEMGDGIYAGEERVGLTACPDCFSIVEGDHCPTCSDGVCVTCSESVPKGTGIFNVELFCEDCDAAMTEAELRETWPAWAKETFSAVAEVRP